MKKEIIIKNKEKNEDIVILKEIIDENKLQDVLKLQDLILEQIEDKSLYAKTTKEEFEFYFKNKDFLIGYYTQENELIAFGVCAKYGYNEHNYGHYIGIKGEDLLLVAQIDTVAVNSEYRGNKLQEKICLDLEEMCKQINMNISTATVSPENIYSLNTFKKLGYDVIKEAKMYGGLDRLILLKNI